MGCRDLIGLENKTITKVVLNLATKQCHHQYTQCEMLTQFLRKQKVRVLSSAVSNPQDLSERCTLYSLADLFN